MQGTTLRCHQTWLAEKSKINGALMGNVFINMGGFPLLCLIKSVFVFLENMFTDSGCVVFVLFTPTYISCISLRKSKQISWAVFETRNVIAFHPCWWRTGLPVQDHIPNWYWYWYWYTHIYIYMYIYFIHTHIYIYYIYRVVEFPD